MKSTKVEARCGCEACRDRRYYLARADEYKRMAAARECVKDVAKRIVDEALGKIGGNG